MSVHLHRLIQYSTQIYLHLSQPVTINGNPLAKECSSYLYPSMAMCFDPETFIHFYHAMASFNLSLMNLKFIVI